MHIKYAMKVKPHFVTYGSRLIDVFDEAAHENAQRHQLLFVTVG
jgi:hypothetical protein